MEELKDLLARVIALRNIARKLEFYGLADDIRLMLKKAGIELRDTKEGTKIKVHKI